MESAVQIPKWNIFKRLAVFIKSKRKKNIVPSYQIISKFQVVLDELEKDSPVYQMAYNAIMLCEEAMRIAKQRLSLAVKIGKLNERLSEVECFEELTEEEAKRLQELLNYYLALTKERTSLMYQLTEFDNSVAQMIKLEEEAGHAITSIDEAEEKQRMLRRDLGYLGGEKAELEYEREFLEKTQSFTYKFNITLVSVFALATIVLVFLFLFKGVSIFMPMAIMSVLLVILIFLLYLLRRRLNYELKVNIKKQQRAVELLNTKNAVFAHYTNFLNYEYKKYKVKNSQMLKKNLKEYENYKHIASRMDNIRNVIFQTENEIETFLKNKKIKNFRSTIEEFAQTINIEDKKAYHSDLTRECKLMEKNLYELDNRHQDIWDLLVSLSEEDNSKEKVVDRIISIYFNEIDRIFY